MRNKLFTSLLTQCGLSNRGAAYLLGVRVDTIRNWKYGKCNVPDGVMDDLTSLHNAIQEIFIDTE